MDQVLVLIQYKLRHVSKLQTGSEQVLGRPQNVYCIVPQLYFADVWMLISEVNFRSFPASEAALTAAAATSVAADSTTLATVVGGQFGYDDYPDEIPTGFEKEVQEDEGVDQGEMLLFFITASYNIRADK